MKRIPVIVVWICCTLILKAQGSGGNQATVYVKQAYAEREPTPWPPLPERDVFICKRIERIIDTREKMNLSMRWPQQSFMDVIYQGIKDGKLTAYKNDSMASTGDYEWARMVGAKRVHVQRQNSEDVYDYSDTTIVSPLSAADFKKFKIIENWIFDRNTGEQYTRIVAIAPIYDLEVNGISLGEQAAFYLSYQQCRKLFVNTELFNRHNDAGRLTYDDFFEQRLFSSYVTKTSNAFDLAIRDFDEFHVNGVEALYEGERQRGELDNTEGDMWEH